MASVPGYRRPTQGVSRAYTCVTVDTETMKALAERWKPIALLLCLILLALTLTTFNTRLAPQTLLFERVGLSVVMPLQQAIASLAQRLSGFWNGYVNLVHVRQENLRLQRQEEALRGQLTHYQEAYVQQQRLRELLGFRALAFPQAVVAEVVGIDPSPWSEVVTINKGNRTAPAGRLVICCCWSDREMAPQRDGALPPPGSLKTCAAPTRLPA